MQTPSIAARLDDFINPIAVKELRQAVKGRFVAAVLILFLLAQLIIVGCVLIFNDNIGQNFQLGRGVFGGLLIVLLVTCVFFLPAFTAARFAAERSDTNVDLLFITTLRPAQIIWGKTIAAMILVFLFFSAALPFMTVTYLLRGLDIPSTLVAVAFNLLLATICIQVSILVGALPGSLLARGFFFLVGLGCLICIFVAGIVLADEFTFGMGVTTWSFWGPAISTVFLMLLGTGLMTMLSVALVSPPSANRALPLRIYLLFVWAATAILAAIWYLVEGDREFWEAWLVMMTLLFSACMLFAVSERHHPGPRVRKRIPRRLPLRILAFFFYSGSAGGVCFSILMLALTVAAYCSLAAAFPSLWYDEESFRFSVTFSLYAIAYLLSARDLKQIFFKYKPAPYTALFAFLLAAFGAVTPMIAGFLIHANTWHRISPLWYIGNPFAVLWSDLGVWPECFWFSFAWATIMFFLAIPWIVRRFREFTRLDALTLSDTETADG